jgi:hypothetical protein
VQEFLLPGFANCGFEATTFSLFISLCVHILSKDLFLDLVAKFGVFARSGLH